MTPDVIVFGPAGGGGKTCTFSVDGLTVNVRPHDKEYNEKALACASSLARSWREIGDLRDKLAKAEANIDSLRARIPPASPARLLGRGCVRFRSGTMYLLNRRTDGWSSFAVTCASWDDLFRRYNVAVVDHGTDDAGTWWEVENFAVRKEGT